MIRECSLCPSFNKHLPPTRSLPPITIIIPPIFIICRITIPLTLFTLILSLPIVIPFLLLIDGYLFWMVFFLFSLPLINICGTEWQKVQKGKEKKHRKKLDEHSGLESSFISNMRYDITTPIGDYKLYLLKKSFTIDCVYLIQFNFIFHIVIYTHNYIILIVHIHIHHIFP